MSTGKTIALTRQTFVGKVMSLLFSMLSRLVTGVMAQDETLRRRVVLGRWLWDTMENGAGF